MSDLSRQESNGARPYREGVGLDYLLEGALKLAGPDYIKRLFGDAEQVAKQQVLDAETGSAS